MEIRRTRIINLDNYISAVPAGATFRVVTDVTERPEALERLGLGAHPPSGARILPEVRGPISRFNAEGRWLVHRDLLKESRYIRTVSWRWTEWNGDEHEDFRDIHRDCYPRDFVVPPAIELTFLETGGRRLIVSPLLAHEPSTRDLAKHTINLTLELLDSCVLVTASLEGYRPPAVRNLNWRLLPPGEYPWERLRSEIEKAIGKAGEGAQRVIMDRQETLRALKPNHLYIGEGGYADYIAYVFEPQGLVVLESIRRDNAIYVFGSNWREVSRLSKAEVLSANHHRARIVHTDGWKDRLRQLLARREAA